MPSSSEVVQFNWMNPPTLEGLTGLEGMREFEIHRSRNITTLDGLERWADTLEKILVTSSKNLTDLSILDKLPNLKRAYINGKEYV